MGLRSTGTVAFIAVLLGAAAARAALPPTGAFRDANEAARSGDLPRALATYRELAGSGHESASLLWNWAQASLARGRQGEALWALLRARELDASDRAVAREIDRVRQGLGLDAAELAPDPRAELLRVARRSRLDLAAIVFLGLSVGLGVSRLVRNRPHRLISGLRWLSLGLGLLAATILLFAGTGHPLGVVVRRGAPLLDAAASSADAVGALREGEVVPILEASTGFLRIEDSSGARGWTSNDDVRSLDAPPGVPAAD